MVEKVGSALLGDPIIIIVDMDAMQFQETWNLFKKYTRLSFTDCSSIILAKAFGIKKIATFDAGFDAVQDLKRIY